MTLPYVNNLFAPATTYPFYPLPLLFLVQCFGFFPQLCQIPSIIITLTLLITAHLPITLLEHCSASCFLGLSGFFLGCLLIQAFFLPFGKDFWSYGRQRTR